MEALKTFTERFEAAQTVQRGLIPIVEQQTKECVNVAQWMSHRLQQQADAEMEELRQKCRDLNSQKCELEKHYEHLAALRNKIEERLKTENEELKKKIDEMRKNFQAEIQSRNASNASPASLFFFASTGQDALLSRFIVCRQGEKDATILKLMAEVKDLQACQSDEHLFEQAGSEVFHMVAGLVAKDAEAQAVPSEEHCKPRPHHFLLF